MKGPRPSGARRPRTVEPRLKPIHPFLRRTPLKPIREAVRDLPRGSVVLDPFAGSGSVLRMAVEAGLGAVGLDADPLAVLMSKVWTSRPSDSLLREAQRVVHAAHARKDAGPPWDEDRERTTAFAEWWFEPRHRRQLCALAEAVAGHSGPSADVLRLALSRLVIATGKGASVAQDAAGGLLSRVRFGDEMNLYKQFLLAVDCIRERLDTAAIRGEAFAYRGDARQASLPDASVEAVITAPPGPDDVDRMPIHRLSLIWLGFSVAELRAVRAGMLLSGGAQGLDLPVGADDDADGAPRPAEALPVDYAEDLRRSLKEMARVLKPGGIIQVLLGHPQRAVHTPAIASLLMHAAADMGLGLRSASDGLLLSRGVLRLSRAGGKTDTGKPGVLTFAA